MHRSLTALAAAAALWGCGVDCEQDILTLERDPVVGETIYSSRCETCHGSDGQGVSGPALTERVPQLSSCGIVDAVIEGPGQMPSFGDDLDEQQLADLVEYVTLEFQ